jgi:tetratricopeptide (TPR) repeat protein
MDEVLYLLGKKPQRAWTWTELVHTRFAKIRLALLALLVVVIGLLPWLMPLRVAESPPSEVKKWSIGFLPFRDLTPKQEASDWPVLIEAMIVDHLIGAEEITVVDPSSLRGFLKSSFSDLGSTSKSDLYQAMGAARIAFVVECTIGKADTHYVVRCTMTDPVTGVFKFSHLMEMSKADDLAGVAKTMSEGILSSVQKSALPIDRERDLRPWLKTRTENFEAMRAFLRASELSYNMRPGGDRYLREAIRLDSTFISPRIWLVSRLTERQHFQEAEQEYHVLLKLKPMASPFEQALIAYAGACVLRDLRAQAQALEQALAYSEKNNILLYLLGRIRFLLGDYAGAIEVILPATEMKWSFQPAYYMLGISYAELKEFAEAYATLKKSLVVEPVYPETYSVLSAVALIQRDSVGSHQYAEEYRRTKTGRDNPPDVVYASLGGIHLSYGLSRSAMQYYGLAVALRPNNGSYHYELGTACFDLKMLDSAASEFTRALRIDSSLFKAHRMVGKVFEARGEKEEARHHYLAYLRYDSTSTEATEVRQRVVELRR